MLTHLASYVAYEHIFDAAGFNDVFESVRSRNAINNKGERHATCHRKTVAW